MRAGFNRELNITFFAWSNSHRLAIHRGNPARKIQGPKCDYGFRSCSHRVVLLYAAVVDRYHVAISAVDSSGRPPEFAAQLSIPPHWPILASVSAQEAFLESLWIVRCAPDHQHTDRQVEDNCDGQRPDSERTPLQITLEPAQPEHRDQSRAQRCDYKPPPRIKQKRQPRDDAPNRGTEPRCHQQTKDGDDPDRQNHNTPFRVLFEGPA